MSRSRCPTHTIVAVDAVGRLLRSVTVDATPAGHVRALCWAEGIADERLWAPEACRHLTRRLEADLLRAGEAVVRVPPKMMAGVRGSARERQPQAVPARPTPKRSEPCDGGCPASPTGS